jgi:hypothetical protein
MKFALHRVEDVPEDVVRQIVVEFMEDLEEGHSPSLDFKDGDDRSHQEVAQAWIERRNLVVQ